MLPEAPSKRVLIMAGGTGGHVFPGLAVAEVLQTAGHEVIWLGTQQGLETRVVPAAGLQLEEIEVSGLRGKGFLTLLLAPLRLARALAQSLVVLRELRPDVVLGMGGFVSGPGGLAAWLLRRPLCLHEQNAVAGLTNQLLCRLARRTMEAFADALPAEFHAEVTGNPVRAELHAIPAPETRLQGRNGALRLLVLGGSQGARRLNQMVPAAAGQISQRLPLEMRHQSGDRDRDLVTRNYATLGINAQVENFIEDMAAAYSWADLVICRAGALTVAELAAVGAAALLVPYPHAVDDHQTANAQWLCDQGGGVLIPESELTASGLAQQLLTLGQDRQRLLDMAVSARQLAQPDAAERIAAICLEVADDRDA